MKKEGNLDLCDGGGAGRTGRNEERVDDSRRSGRHKTGIDGRRGETNRRLDCPDRLEGVAEDAVLGIARRRLGRCVPVGVLVVDNQCRIAQHVIAVVV